MKKMKKPGKMNTGKIGKKDMMEERGEAHGKAIVSKLKGSANKVKAKLKKGGR